MRFPDDYPDDGEPDFSDDEIDADFPVGDGTAETEAVVVCPYCGETVTIALDPGGGAVQEYVEDCEVCCQPWLIALAYRDDGSVELSVTALDQ